MQRNALFAIAAGVGLGLGVSAGFLAIQAPPPSPQPNGVTDRSTGEPSSPSRLTERDGERSSLEESNLNRPTPGRSSDDTASTERRDRPQAQSSSPSLLRFDAQATHCPENGGGGALVSLYMTEHHLVYVCQGGSGREDWRELDYYAVNRAQPDDWIRLRAFVTSGPGVYAENGSYRYTIDPARLTVQENRTVLLDEPVLRCKGSCS